MKTKVVKQISECFIKPKCEVEESKQPYYLAPMDLIMLSVHYIQKGLLFPKPPKLNGEKFEPYKFLESLKDSLSLTLVHFYPLAGRLVTLIDEDRHESVIFVDCNKGPGAGFIHASLDMTVSYILSPPDVPQVVQSLFDHDRAVNHDGHTRPLLSVQVTELADGIFIGCSMNHALADGTSYWHFWRSWSEIHRAKNAEETSVSHQPVYNSWFLEGHGPEIALPFTHPEEFIRRYETPQLRERIFHFSSESIATLKAKANKETDSNKISSFQALSALCWRSIARANCTASQGQVTECRIAINNRHRLNPPLPQEYFGNCINAVKSSTTFAELHEHSLGWTASLLHQIVVNQNDRTVNKHMKRWLKSPYVYQYHRLGSNSVLMGSSPRFEMYGNEFGLGKAVAVRSGYANKFAGKVTAYPGYEGEGSVDLEICLPPDSMSALETDQEFMDAVSLPPKALTV